MCITEDCAESGLGTAFVLLKNYVALQKALKMIASWPWYPDSLAISNVIAKLYGAPTLKEVLGADTLSPFQLQPKLD